MPQDRRERIEKGYRMRVAGHREVRMVLPFLRLLREEHSVAMFVLYVVVHSHAWNCDHRTLSPIMRCRFGFLARVK